MIPYKVKIITGKLEKSTLKSDAFIKIHGSSKKGGKKNTHRSLKFLKLTLSCNLVFLSHAV